MRVPFFDDDENMDIQSHRYLLYLGDSIQPDVSYAVLQLTRHIARLGEARLKEAKRVLFRYLKGTIDLVLHYTKEGGKSLQWYVDASNDGDEGDRCSTPRCAVTVMGLAMHCVRQV